MFSFDKKAESSAITKFLLEALNIEVSEYAIKKNLSKQPYDEPFFNIVNILPDFNIDSLLLKLSQKEIHRIQEFNFPFISLLSDNGENRCALITKIENDFIHYRTTSGFVSEKLENFASIWSGYNLLIFPSENSGDINSKKNKQENQVENFMEFGIVLIILSLWASAAYYLYSLNYAIINFYLWSLKFVGIVISSLLVIHESDNNNSIVSKVCSIGKSDCDKVISNENAKLFGIISWSVLGFIYFSGSAFLLLIGGNLFNTLPILFLFNIPCIVFSFYSMWYQFFKVKELCYFCLLTLIVFWLEFAIFFLNISSVQNIAKLLNVSLILIVVFSYSLPILGIYFLTSSLKTAKFYRDIKRELNSLKYDSEIFNNLWKANPTVLKQNISSLKLLANEGATNSITIVTSPTCKPCFTAHKYLEYYLERKFDNLNIDLIFAIEPSKDNKSEKYKVARRIVALYHKKGMAIANKAISDWFCLNRKEKFEDWQVKYSVEGEDEFNDHLESFEDWCNINIDHTPTILFNGREIPKSYNLSDIRYFIN